MSTPRALFGGAVLVYFIIALEVLIMISPFAAFFYAAMNPLLLFLDRWSATRWLSAFFLPHMVLPPGFFLQAVRVTGSVLFVAGAAAFLVCAVQVYFHKLFRRDPALGGLYAWIRHPQYLALAATGLGLAILWPRFLTIVLWVVMVGLYYLLARDEERRMLNQFGDRYRGYMERTGAFLPRGLERMAGRLPLLRSRVLGPLLGFLAVAVVAVGGAFALRAYTVDRLPLWSEGRVTALAVLPDDATMLRHRLSDVLALPEVKSRLGRSTGPILAYVVPTRYVMQGMIADTGGEWRLYRHHQTLTMIADWILHPFRHLKGGSMSMHHGGAGEGAHGGGPAGVERRLIFLRVEPAGGAAAPRSLFGIDATRTPEFYADVDLHNLIVHRIENLGPGTGWGNVPTPMF
jgi:protein-S-isoprenylcysteine O-methyltransferase Ste14